MGIRNSRSDRVIRVTTIFVRLRDILDPSGTQYIDPEDSWTDYIEGDRRALAAFADFLNRDTIFHLDGLSLQPGDLRPANSVGDICVAIVEWYRRHNWTVVV